VLDLDPVASFFTLVVALACILASQFWDHILRSLKRLMLFLKHFVSETALAKAGLNRGKDFSFFRKLACRLLSFRREPIFFRRPC
jgi:hypothetical protein